MASYRKEQPILKLFVAGTLMGSMAIGCASKSGTSEYPVAPKVTDTVGSVPEEIQSGTTTIESQQETIGETALGNPIKMVTLSQKPGLKETLMIVGGIHPGEKTGWLSQDKSQTGWLTMVKQWFMDNPQQWKDLNVAMVDINPDGKGRQNPNKVDLARNFACTSCNWTKTDPNTRDYADADGPEPLSEPESQTLINAVNISGPNIRLLVFLHNVFQPSGLVDPGHCDGSADKSCLAAQEIARLSGAKYSKIWSYRGNGAQYPEGLAGQPADYFSERGYPTVDIEFPIANPSKKQTSLFCKAIVSSLNQ